MTRVPLRRIVSRALTVYTHHRGAPLSFTVNESLSCGHVHVAFLWDFLDLVNGYTTNADATARRRYCHACANAQQVQSATVGRQLHADRGVYV